MKLFYCKLVKSIGNLLSLKPQAVKPQGIQPQVDKPPCLHQSCFAASIFLVSVPGVGRWRVHHMERAAQCQGAVYLQSGDGLYSGMHQTCQTVSFCLQDDTMFCWIICEWTTHSQVYLSGILEAVASMKTQLTCGFQLPFPFNATFR